MFYQNYRGGLHVSHAEIVNDVCCISELFSLVRLITTFSPHTVNCEFMDHLV